MRVEIFYEAPTEVFELNEDQEVLWIEYRRLYDKANELRLDKGYVPELTESYRKADLAYDEFFASIEAYTEYPDLEIEDIAEW